MSTENATRDTVVHEVFHALGLTHTRDDANVMRSAPGETRCAPVLSAAQRAAVDERAARRAPAP